MVLGHRHQRPVAVAYEPDYPQWVVLDPEDPTAGMIGELGQRFPGARVSVRSQTRDGRLAVVLVSSDVDPGVFLLVDTTTGETKPLLRRREAVDPASMRPMEAFAIESRDGLPVHGYLTLPVEEPEAPLPTIVMPHGGPHGVRDRWAFHPEVQLFASRGFAVLQVNFRGSGGYGSDFEAADYQSWGDAVQHDILDAIQWSVSQKLTDPARICTYGGSFGGYSAVQLATLAPELIACAVGVAGVYDLPGLLEEGDLAEDVWAKRVLEAYLGRDEGALRSASPVHRVDRLRAPVLLVHGEEDQRAPIAQAKAMCAALKAAGKSCETFFVAGEGHGFRVEAHRYEAMSRVLDFVQRHIGSDL